MSNYHKRHRGQIMAQSSEALWNHYHQNAPNERFFNESFTRRARLKNFHINNARRLNFVADESEFFGEVRRASVK